MVLALDLNDSILINIGLSMYENITESCVDNKSEVHLHLAN